MITDDYISSVVNLWKTEKNSSKYLDYMAKSCKKYKKHASLDAAVKDYTDKIHRSIVLSRYNVSRKDDVLFPDELIMRSNSVRFACKELLAG